MLVLAVTISTYSRPECTSQKNHRQIDQARPYTLIATCYVASRAPSIRHVLMVAHSRSGRSINAPTKSHGKSPSRIYMIRNPQDQPVAKLIVNTETEGNGSDHHHWWHFAGLDWRDEFDAFVHGITIEPF